MTKAGKKTNGGIYAYNRKERQNRKRHTGRQGERGEGSSFMLP